MDMEEYRQVLRDEIRKNRVLSSMVRQKVVVAEDEMRSYYEQHNDQFRRPKTVGLRIIVHPSRERVKQVRRAIASGEVSFAQAAASVSQGPGADQGGRLGSFAWKDLKPDWRRMLDGLEAGQMTPVFSLQGNAALLAVEDVANKQVQPFEAVKDKIRQQIYGQKLEDRYQEYIQGLKEKAVIDLRLEQTG
jgi:peptidyl-prolyl cis-trans isomerase SurA